LCYLNKLAVLNNAVDGLVQIVAEPGVDLVGSYVELVEKLAQGLVRVECGLAELTVECVGHVELEVGAVLQKGPA